MKAQTIAFTALVVFEVVRLQLIRDEYKLGVFSNKLLVGAVGLSLALQLLVIYTPLNKVFKVVPLGVLDWVWLLLAAGVLIVVTKVLSKVIKRWY